MRSRYFGVITKIEIGKRNKNRVNIYLDEEFAFACSMEIVYRYHFKEGKDIDLQILEEVIEEDNYIKGKSDSLKFLGKSYKTQKQIYDKLLDKGYDVNTINRVIDFLEEYDFVDDERYAELYIKEKMTKEGTNKIKFSLLSRGIKEEIIMEKLEEIDSSVGDDALLKVAESKYNQIVKGEDDKRKIYKKLSEFLFRKGYDWENIKGVVNKILKMDSYD
ncbi:hypothetical protein GCM10008905_04480 [Clostridium malenominatum]|uniref:Regulatory protein RecX n=1 Tax=Clostridium malenominatum TaxID=1539 RepID=A0ABP3TXR9_9CLOT